MGATPHRQATLAFLNTGWYTGQTGSHEAVRRRAWATHSWPAAEPAQMEIGQSWGSGVLAGDVFMPGVAYASYGGGAYAWT